MTLRFACTLCGRCCHDLRLTLSVAEAIRWCEAGHGVEVLAEAIPLGDPPPAHDAAAAWRHANATPVTIGGVPFGLRLMLVARHAGPCPHLRADMTCGNYEARPRICRIYPLQSRPGETVDPAGRKCPAEAWEQGGPLTDGAGAPADGEARAIVAAHRAEQVADAPARARLAALLGLEAVALAGEGLAVLAPPPDRLAELLRRTHDADGDGPPPATLTLVTNRNATLAMLDDLGCPARLADPGGYLASFEAG